MVDQETQIFLRASHANFLFSTVHFVLTNFIAGDEETHINATAAIIMMAHCNQTSLLSSLSPFSSETAYSLLQDPRKGPVL
jgi:hypothetical protein